VLLDQQKYEIQTRILLITQEILSPHFRTTRVFDHHGMSGRSLGSNCRSNDFLSALANVASWPVAPVQ
jgi:hypothetical protein